MLNLTSALPTPLLALLAPLKPSDVPVGLRVNAQGANGLAIDGFDPVAYTVDGRARRGSPDLSVVLGGASWRFAAETHLQRFLHAPGRYLPAFGGFCAAGLALGALRPVDPAVFSLTRGRLHLFRDRAARAWWHDNPVARLACAEANWRAITTASPTRQ